MIILIDNEHVSGYDKPWGQQIMAARLRIKYRLEDLTGDHCLVVRYDHVNPRVVEQTGARAVFISGNSAAATDYDPGEQEGLRAVISDAAVPMFGFCGGHQIMAETFGAPLAEIGPLPDDTPVDEDSDFAPGMKKEFGYAPVTIDGSHPLLDGLGRSPVVRHAHAWEIKSVPDGFVNLASTETTPIQMIVHESLPIVGTQFHPEYWTDDHPAGRTLIHNFARWAGLVDDEID